MALSLVAIAGRVIVSMLQTWVGPGRTWAFGGVTRSSSRRPVREPSEDRVLDLLEAVVLSELLRIPHTRRVLLQLTSRRREDDDKRSVPDLDELVAFVRRPSTDTAGEVGKTLREAERLLRSATRGGVNAVPFGESRYPGLLVTISDPPPVLWLTGDVQAFSGPAVAIVGSRAGSPYACEIAERLGSELSDLWCHGGERSRARGRCGGSQGRPARARANGRGIGLWSRCGVPAGARPVGPFHRVRRGRGERARSGGCTAGGPYSHAATGSSVVWRWRLSSSRRPSAAGPSSRLGWRPTKAGGGHGRSWQRADGQKLRWARPAQGWGKGCGECGRYP